MNTHVRDNLNFLKSLVNVLINDSLLPIYPVVGKQTSALTKNNNTTLGDAPGLTFPIAASEQWAWAAYIKAISGAGATFKVTATAPAGATGQLGIIGEGTGSAGTAYGTGLALTGLNVETTLIMQGFVINSTTAGAIQIQMAQNAAVAVNTIFRANSFIVAQRFA
jgi:hypothetical protein